MPPPGVAGPPPGITGPPPGIVGPPPNMQMPNFDTNTALAQIAAYSQQIADSEANLRAQFDSIELQKEVYFQCAIR